MIIVVSMIFKNKTLSDLYLKTSMSFPTTVFDMTLMRNRLVHGNLKSTRSVHVRICWKKMMKIYFFAMRIIISIVVVR